jgi:hypothetical protein
MSAGESKTTLDTDSDAVERVDTCAQNSADHHDATLFAVSPRTLGAVLSLDIPPERAIDGRIMTTTSALVH